MKEVWIASLRKFGDSEKKDDLQERLAQVYEASNSQEGTNQATESNNTQYPRVS